MKSSIIVVPFKKEFLEHFFPPDMLGPCFFHKGKNQIFPLIKTNVGVKPDVCQ
jgi:hypothetical protein